MIHPGPAHSANMSVLHFPEESAIFVVDFISLGRLPFQTMAGYDHELWTGEFRDVEALGAEFVIPAHGRGFDGRSRRVSPVSSRSLRRGR